MGRGCNCAANEEEYAAYERFRRTPKSVLYDLHWNQEMETEDIAEKYNVTDRFVRRWFNKHGIQYASIQNQSTHNHRNRFVFDRRKRKHYYELYWGRDLNYGEIAEQKDISENTVARVFRQRNIARIPQSYGNKWYDKERGIPQQFKMPRDERRKTTSSEDNPNGELPEDPDPQKYIAKPKLHRDKDRLYELHWKYGCSMAHIDEMIDVNRDIRRCFRELGIPYRQYSEHIEWEPHLGVPPMFEWPHGNDPTVDDDSEKFEWSLSQESAIGD